MLFPNRATVTQSLREYRRDGEAAFLSRYSSGVGPRAHYLVVAEKLYPLKAVWAASHRPPIHTRTFQTYAAKRGLEHLGYEHFIEGRLARQYMEGQRIFREATVLTRSARLVEEAKKHYGLACLACGFDFEVAYGVIGKGYIECHHVDPLSGREGRSQPTDLKDLTVLCSNCHRMVHKKPGALTLEQLRSAIKGAQRHSRR